MIPKVLTIAGSDSGGGAGIQADLKTFAALGTYGTSVITSVTAQNTLGVQGVQNLDSEFIGRQMDSVLSDIDVQSVKTGMLANRSIVEMVAAKLKEYSVKNLVIDPVMVAKSGDRLLDLEACEVLKKKLFPLAMVVTPNTDEAQVLTGYNIETRGDMEKAACKIHAMGPRYVVIKGGHLTGDPVDLLYDGKEFITFAGKRIQTRNTHGTGCTFSAALAAALALGKGIQDAVAMAKKYVTQAIKFSFAVGRGYGPTHHFASVYREMERYRTLQTLQEAGNLLESRPVGLLVPEVQSNLLVALPYARGPEDVAAFPGRIVRVDDKVKIVSIPRFGASRHMAMVLLGALRYDPTMRATMNIKATKEVLNAAKKAGLKIEGFHREKEPVEFKNKPENKFVEWGTCHVIKTIGYVPDGIYDHGGWGLEAQLRVIGTDPLEVVQKILRIAKAFSLLVN